jgi:hypothetical protein
MKILAQAQKAVENYPAKITAAQFKKMILENPSVFEHWETPLEITEFVDCTDSPITHLSPLLTFAGRDNKGNSASFAKCLNLQIATGTFHGYVEFSHSNIEKIENLTVTETNGNRDSAGFWCCKKLETATGTFKGCASFSGSNIHSIQNLHIENPDKDGIYLLCMECENLHHLEPWDLSKKIDIEPQKIEAEKKRRSSLQKFIKETQPKHLPFL